MPSPTVYEFVFREGSGGTSTASSPQFWQQHSAQRAQTAAGQRSSSSNAKDTPEAKSFAQAMFDALDKASRVSFIGPLGKASMGFVRPLLDIAQLFRQIFGRTGQAANAATSAGAGAARASAAIPRATPGTQTYNLRNAVFNMGSGGRILIMGGQVAFGEGGSATGPFTAAAQAATTRRPRGAANPGTGLIPTTGGLPAVQSGVPMVRRDRITSAFVTGTNAAQGHLTVGMARGLGATGGSAAAGGGLLASINPVMAAFVGLALVAGGLIVAFRYLTQRANEQSQTLAKYSGELAGAQAVSRANTIMQQLRSAQSQGAGLAKLVEAQNKLDVTLTQIGDKMQAQSIGSQTAFNRFANDALKSLFNIQDNTADERGLGDGHFIKMFTTQEDLDIGDQNTPSDLPDFRRIRAHGDNPAGFGNFNLR